MTARTACPAIAFRDGGSDAPYRFNGLHPMIFADDFAVA
jgi:hypothetical protein